MGLEIAGRDHYAWLTASLGNVKRHTLFPEQKYGAISAGDIRRHLYASLDALNPSAVCVNGWAVPEAVAALRWTRRNGARAILMSETFESGFNPLKRTVKRWRVAQCEAALVGGRLHAAYLKKLGFRGETLELGYDVVDNEHFAKPVVSRPTWHRDAQPYFFANTRFVERKGIDALLRAYASYRALAPRPQLWNLVISGSGAMERQWKDLAGSLGISQNVFWPGFLQYEDLPAAYQTAGAFVHPARQEPWGLVVNEAAAAGLPLLVGRRVGAACELVRDGDNGFLIEPDDVEAFARLLQHMSALPESTRRGMGRRSQQTVSAFGPERFGQALAKCLGLGPASD